jgi:hypothetical protein
MVPADGVTDTTVGRPASPFTEPDSGGGRKPPLPPLPRLRAPRPLGSQPTVVTVQQALGADACLDAGAVLSQLPPVHSAPLVTTASAPMQAHASASAPGPGCAADAPPGLQASVRQHSAEACAGMENSIRGARFTKREASISRSWIM